MQPQRAPIDDSQRYPTDVATDTAPEIPIPEIPQRESTELDITPEIPVDPPTPV